MGVVPREARTEVGDKARAETRAEARVSKG